MSLDDNVLFRDAIPPPPPGFGQNIAHIVFMPQYSRLVKDHAMVSPDLFEPVLSPIQVAGVLYAHLGISPSFPSPGLNRLHHSHWTVTNSLQAIVSTWLPQLLLLPLRHNNMGKTSPILCLCLGET